MPGGGGRLVGPPVTLDPAVLAVGQPPPPPPPRPPTLPPPPPRPALGCAYVFLLYGPACEEYFLGAAFAAYSLAKHMSVHRRVLLVTSDVPKKVHQAAELCELFDEITPVGYIEASEVFFSNPQSQRRFGNIFTKYRVLGLTRYEKVMLLDTDLFIRANLDFLFDFPAPAAMARGPKKPEEGQLMPPALKINAGVVLLKPDAGLLDVLVGEVTGPKPRKLTMYNSPDADYLTEHPELTGKWTHIPLACNFQLEYDRLDAKAGTVRFSSAREAHFSDEGAAMEYASLKVAHFSGAKPWAQLLDDCSVLQGLRCEGAGKQPGLGEKLVEALAEYALEVAAFQGLCSQLGLGPGLLWAERVWEVRELPVPAAVARTRLHAALPPGGRWYEATRPGAVTWVPPGAGLPMAGTPFRRPEPVAAYLEIVPGAASVAVGRAVKVRGKGAGVEEEPFTVKFVSEKAKTAVVRRTLPLPEGWAAVLDGGSGCEYYHNDRTGKVQWEYPELRAPWEAVVDEETSAVYYHNRQTGETVWEPPNLEELELGWDELDVVDGAEVDLQRCVATVWRRSFMAPEDRGRLQAMREALLAVAPPLETAGDEAPCPTANGACGGPGVATFPVAAG